MGDLNVYESTADGITRQSATPGSRVDQRFARSKRWRLIGDADGSQQRAIVEAPPEGGASGTFDDPEGEPLRDADGGPRDPEE